MSTAVVGRTLSHAHAFVGDHPDVVGRDVTLLSARTLRAGARGRSFHAVFLVAGWDDQLTEHGVDVCWQELLPTVVTTGGLIAQALSPTHVDEGGV